MATSKSKSKPAKTKRKSSRTAKRHAKSAVPARSKSTAATKAAASQAASSKSPASSSSKQSAVLKMLIRTEGHHDRRDHEGDRLAATFGARLLCGRSQEEARPQSRLREGRRSNASIGSPNQARRGDGHGTDSARSTHRSSRRGRVGSAGDDADCPVARQIPGSVSDRTAESVRSGPASTQHRASDSGEGLWRPLPSGAAPARSDDEGICCEAERQDRAAAPDQAGLGPCPGMERQEPPRHGAGGGLCL